MTETRRELHLEDRRSGQERRYQERRSNWRRATALLQRDLLDDLLKLEGEMRLALVYPDSLTYWANALAAVIRRHQEP